MLQLPPWLLPATIYFIAAFIIYFDASPPSDATPRLFHTTMPMLRLLRRPPPTFD